MTLKRITKSSLKELSPDKFWRIKYKDYNDVITTRTIYNPKFCMVDEPDYLGKSKKIGYIQAKCILRNYVERYFRIDRIQKLQVLDLTPSSNIYSSQ